MGHVGVESGIEGAEGWGSCHISPTSPWKQLLSDTMKLAKMDD